MTDASHSLDDLTRDLRDVRIAHDAELSHEAASAIDRLRADHKKYWQAAHDFAAMTGALPGDDVFGHLGYLKRTTVSDAIKSTANLYLSNVGTERSGEALAGLRKVVADAGYEMLAPSEAVRRRADPKSFAYDVDAAVVLFKPEGEARRPRRQLSLDGGKYKIVLADVIPPDEHGDGNPTYLPSAFLRHGKPWPAGDEAYRHANVVAHFAEALWERSCHPPKIVETPSGAKHIYWDVAAKTITTPDTTYVGVEPLRGETDSEWSFEFKQPFAIKRPQNAHALDAASLRCDKCGATGTLGDYCSCDPEEALPRDAPDESKVNFEANFHPSLADLRARADATIPKMDGATTRERSDAIYEALKWAAGWR